MKNVGNTSANCGKNMYLPILHPTLIELCFKLQEIAFCNTALIAMYR